MMWLGPCPLGLGPTPRHPRVISRPEHIVFLQWHCEHRLPGAPMGISVAERRDRLPFPLTPLTPETGSMSPRL